VGPRDTAVPGAPAGGAGCHLCWLAGQVLGARRSTGMRHAAGTLLRTAVLMLKLRLTLPPCRTTCLLPQPDATPSYGKDTLEDFFRRAVKEGLKVGAGQRTGPWLVLSCAWQTMSFVGCWLRTGFGQLVCCNLCSGEVGFTCHNVL